MLGPVIRAEVGDTLKVVFKHMVSHNHTCIPTVFRYTKENEGLFGAGQDFDGNAVSPGSTWTYMWEVPGKLAAPAPFLLKERQLDSVAKNVRGLGPRTRHHWLGCITRMPPEPKKCTAAW